MSKRDDEELLKQLATRVEKGRGVRLRDRKTLVLNADFQPMRYFPLSLEEWEWTMFLIVKGIITGVERITVLEEYDDVYVHTPSRAFALPSVVAHKQFVPPPKRVPFTKRNIFLRDDFTCQYTGEKCSVEDLTFDHVIPRAQGGKTTWTNIVAASRRINEMKDNRTPKEAGLHLIHGIPREPTHYELLEKGKQYPPKYLHESWMDYLYWSTPLEDEDED